MEHRQETNIPGRVDDYFTMENGTELHFIHYTSVWTAKAYSPDHNGAVYVDGAPEPDMPTPEYSRKGENPELDAAWRKFNKAELTNMRAVIQDVVDSPDFDQLPEVVRTVLTGKLKFSRYAGCSCPCSPGFLGANRQVLGLGGSLHITTAELAAKANRRRELVAAQLEAAGVA